MATAAVFAECYNRRAPDTDGLERLRLLNDMLGEMGGRQIIGSPAGTAEFLFNDGSVVVMRLAA